MRNLISATLFVGVLGSSFLAAAQGGGPPPSLPDVPEPAENPITEPKRLLGKILFWDEQLSSTNTMSCGTCHIPAFGGADPRLGLHPGADEVFNTDDDIIGSPGVPRRDSNGDPVSDPLFGNARQVTGRAAQSYFASMFSDENFWDGRASSTFIDPEDEVTVVIAEGGGLESQAVGPILSSVEMAFEGRTWDDVRNKLAGAIPMLLASNLPPDLEAALDANPSYPELFNAAFGSSAITASRIGMAIASYERTLVADQTPWDLFNDGDNSALTANQQQGLDFLVQDTPCFNCHEPPLFSDDNFRNIGLRPSAEDLGRQEVSGQGQDAGEFKTPSLRNIGLRASLMHVGWVTDVQDAIDFYNAGTQNTGHVQFTADQDDIPGGGGGGGGGGGVDEINEINIPANMQDEIVDFLVNGLTDPRVAAEEFPFDRPTLLSEMTFSNEIHVDFDFDGMEDGSASKPYDTLDEAMIHVNVAGTLVIQPGSADAAMTLSFPVTITAASGTVTLGATP